MAEIFAQPRFDQPVVDGRGLVTRPWADYWLRMASAQSDAALRAMYEALAARVAELEAQGVNFQILGQQSVSVVGSPSSGAIVISLLGDEQSPGVTEYYGTGPDGKKGWYPVESALLAKSGELTKEVASTGVVTFGLADLPDSGAAGTLVKITRDSKGRIASMQPATTDDLPQGTVNKYFPEAPTDGWPYARQASGWQALDGPNSPYVLLKLAVLTDQAGRVLTDQQGRVLMANVPAIPYAWLTGVPTYRFPPMTLAQANALAPVLDGQPVLITDLSGGREPCWWDETVAKFRRFSDRSIAN